MKKIGMAIMTAFLMAVAFIGTTSQTVSALTCPAGTPGEGRGEVNSLAECSISETEDTLMPTIGTIINVALGVLGIVAVIVIIYGGFTYMTSSGDAAKITKAKNTIIYGVIGLVIALLAFAIVNFVISNVFNAKGASGDSSLSNPEKTKSGTR